MLVIMVKIIFVRNLFVLKFSNLIFLNFQKTILAYTGHIQAIARNIYNVYTGHMENDPVPQAHIGMLLTELAIGHKKLTVSLSIPNNEMKSVDPAMLVIMKTM